MQIQIWSSSSSSTSVSSSYVSSSSSPSSSIKGDVQSLVHLSWFLSWPSWKSLGLDPATLFCPFPLRFLRHFWKNFLNFYPDLLDWTLLRSITTVLSFFSEILKIFLKYFCTFLWWPSWKSLGLDLAAHSITTILSFLLKIFRLSFS